MIVWSDDRIAALSNQDLKNLLVNAERKSAADIIALCQAELERRDAAKPRKASKPRTELKEFEHGVSEQLAEVGKAMAAKYDLSEETAKANSAGVKGFKAHKLLDARVLQNSAACSATVRSRSNGIFVPPRQGYRLARGFSVEGPAGRISRVSRDRAAGAA